MEISSKYGYDTTKTSTFKFYGLNRTRRGSSGEFSEMQNMGTLEYPCAAPRGNRENIAETESTIDAIAAPDRTTAESVDGLTGVSGCAFWYNGVKKSGEYYLSPNYSWQIIRMGNLYVINGYNSSEKSSVMYYYNIDTDEFELNTKQLRNLIVIAGSDKTGNWLATFHYGYNAVKEYVATDGETEIKNSDFFDTYGGGKTIQKSNIFEEVFSEGDEITIEGFPAAETNFGQQWFYSSSSDEVVPNTDDYSDNNTVDTDKYASLESISKNAIVRAVVDSFSTTAMDVDGFTTRIHRIYFKLYNKENAEIDFSDMYGTTRNVFCSGIVLTKKTKCFDNISVHLGRVFGTVPNGNAIYSNASDIFNDYSASSVNSGYAAYIPSDTPGTFTGLCEYGNELVAFKEDNITIISGYEISGLYKHVIYGIGCIDPKSIAVTPNGVIFLSHTGFQIFTGNTPSCISSKLNTKYKSAVAGFDGNIYYASALRSDGVYELLAYDMRYGTWHVQDDIKATGFFRFLEKFYLVTDTAIYLCDSDTYDGSFFEWSFTSVKTHDNTLDTKALNEIWIRADVSEGAYFKVFTKVDDDSEWRCHSAFRTPGLNVFRCPIRAVPCYHYQYKIKGCGHVVFYEIELQRNQDNGRRHKDFEETENSKPVLNNTVNSYVKSGSDNKSKMGMY